MSFWGKLFGTEKALTAVVDGVSNGLDKLVYTDEEKADAAAKDRAEARQMIVGWMTATQGQNLSRRLIALSITGVWLGMYLISTIANMVAIFTDTEGEVTVEKLEALSSVAKQSAMDMNPAVMLILAFYFSAPWMGEFAKSAVTKAKLNLKKGS